jgi:hypothetical protein
LRLATGVERALLGSLLYLTQKARLAVSPWPVTALGEDQKPECASSEAIGASHIGSRAAKPQRPGVKANPNLVSLQKRRTDHFDPRTTAAPSRVNGAIKGQRAEGR